MILLDSVTPFSASWKSNEWYAVALYAEAVDTALPPRIMSLSTARRALDWLLEHVRVERHEVRQPDRLGCYGIVTRDGLPVGYGAGAALSLNSSSSWNHGAGQCLFDTG
jgi:hypothetical protein